jgi:hypothetical protein
VWHGRGRRAAGDTTEDVGDAGDAIGDVGTASRVGVVVDVSASSGMGWDTGAAWSATTISEVPTT